MPLASVAVPVTSPDEEGSPPSHLGRNLSLPGGPSLSVQKQTRAASAFVGNDSIAAER